MLTTTRKPSYIKIFIYKIYMTTFKKLYMSSSSSSSRSRSCIRRRAYKRSVGRIDPMVVSAASSAAVTTEEEAQLTTKAKAAEVARLARLAAEAQAAKEARLAAEAQAAEEARLDWLNTKAPYVSALLHASVCVFYIHWGAVRV